MLIEYSKPSGDIATHTEKLIAQNAALLTRQMRLAAMLCDRPPRTQCLLCEAALDAVQPFFHRGVPYFACGNCGHVQCAILPPVGYPQANQEFADIYGPLAHAAYRERTEKIYAPKLEWAMRVARQVNLGNLLQRSWVELGSGAGSFIDALRNAGVSAILGLEAEEALVRQAIAALGAPLVRHFSNSLAQAVRDNPAEIYAAWFVLEHCPALPEFLDALNEKPKGTIVAFAVPTYGLGTLIESAFTDHYARSLDSVLHLQLFTDNSIKYAMKRAGFEILAEWIFGQDAEDLYRALMVSSSNTAFAKLDTYRSTLLETFAQFQKVIDRARLSDARHVLAVRR